MADKPKVPQDKKEANRYIRDIATEQKEINRLKAEFNEAVRRLEEQTGKALAPHEKKVRNLFEGLMTFAEARRDELTEGKGKTVKFPAGIVRWKTSPWKVIVRDTDEAITSAKKLGLEDLFVRTKEDFLKSAAKLEKNRKEAEKIKGVSLVRYEVFEVKPNELEVGISEDLRRIKE